MSVPPGLECQKSDLHLVISVPARCNSKSKPQRNYKKHLKTSFNWMHIRYICISLPTCGLRNWTHSIPRWFLDCSSKKPLLADGFEETKGFLRNHATKPSLHQSDDSFKRWSLHPDLHRMSLMVPSANLSYQSNMLLADEFVNWWYIYI